MAVSDAYVCPGFLTPVLTQLFFPKSPTTFLACLCRGERRKYAGKKSCLDRGSNSQPPGHESDTLTTEPLGRGDMHWKKGSKCICKKQQRRFACAVRAGTPASMLFVFCQLSACKRTSLPMDSIGCWNVVCEDDLSDMTHHSPLFWGVV